MPEAWDATSVDWFNPPSEGVEFKPHGRPIQAVPEINRLFTIQKNLVKAINASAGLPPDPKNQHGTLRANLETAYRQLNDYLRMFSGQGSGAIT